jgi:hypothetical protein
MELSFSSRCQQNLEIIKEHALLPISLILGFHILRLKEPQIKKKYSEMCIVIDYAVTGFSFL